MKREYFGLPETAIAPRLGAAIFLVLHSAFFTLALGSLIAGNAGWVTVTSLIINGLCAWHRAWQLNCIRQANRAEVELDAAKQVRINSAMFMPYSVCPKCGVEELHWLKSTEVTDFPAYFKRVCEFNNVSASWYGPKDVDRIAREWAAQRAKNSDVIRECRECGHTWGQKVGAQ